jgi:hypothetical protein
MSDFTNSGTADIDNILAQTAYQIGPIIYRETLPTANWEALVPRSELPEGVGDSLSTTIYDRSIPTLEAGGSVVGVNWARLGTEIVAANSFGSTEGQMIEGAAGETIGSTAAARLAFIKFKKRMRNYFLSVANVKSPYIDVHTVRTAAAREQQLGNIQGILTEATKWVWARRHEEEFERSAGNFVPCMAAATSPILSTVDIRTGAVDPETGAAATGGTANNPFFGLKLIDLELNTAGASNADVVPTAYVSNAVLDRMYNRLVRTTDHAKAYGITDGRPTFALRIGSDASLTLMRESGIRDDVRKSARVDDLLKPLGVDAAFRGFYHMVDDLIPRYSESGGVLTRVEPFDSDGNYVSAYDTADYEVFYVVQKEVMECQVPGSNVSAPGVSYGAVDYRGSFDWLNIQDEIKNPKKTIGFFYGTFASASKPIKPLNGYVGLFKRTSGTPAL